MQYLQQAVYFSAMKNSDDVARYFYDLPTTHKRRNPHIFPSEQDPLRVVNLAAVSKHNSLAPLNRRFVHSEGNQDQAVNASVYLIADFASHSARGLAVQSLRLLVS